MIALGDSDGNGAMDGDIAFCRFPTMGGPSMLLWPPGTVHKSGANIVFCDGHVEWAKQSKWIELKEETARRWNNDNKPHRELWFGSTGLRP